MQISDVKIINGELCVSSSGLMEMMDIASKTTLGGWARQGCPKLQRGWWPLQRVFAWKGVIKDGKDGQSLSSQKLEYEADYKRLQAESLELKNAVAKGDFIPRDVIVSQLSSYHVMLKRSLVGLSRKLSVEVAAFADATTARRVERELADIIADALTQMSIGGVYEPEQEKRVRSRRKAKVS